MWWLFHLCFHNIFIVFILIFLTHSWQFNSNIFKLHDWELITVVLESSLWNFTLLDRLIIQLSNLSLLAMNNIIWMINQFYLNIFCHWGIHNFEHLGSWIEWNNIDLPTFCQFGFEPLLTIIDSWIYSTN